MRQPVQLPELLPCKGIMTANRPSREHSGGVYCSCCREQQSQLQPGSRCPGSSGADGVCRPPPPHIHCSPCCSAPLGAEGSSGLSCGSVLNKTASLAKSQASRKEQNSEQVLFSGSWSRNWGLGRRRPPSWIVVGVRGTTPLRPQPRPPPPPAKKAAASQGTAQTRDPPCARHRQGQRERNRRCSCARFSF